MSTTAATTSARPSAATRTGSEAPPSPSTGSSTGCLPTTARARCTAVRPASIRRVWTAALGEDSASVELRYTSADGGDGLPGRARGAGRLHARRRHAADRLRGDDRPADGRQPDEPHLLQPRRGGLGDDRRPRPLQLAAVAVHAGRRRPDPDRRDRSGRRHAVRLPQARRRSARASATTDPQLVSRRGYDHNFVLDRAAEGSLVNAARVWRADERARPRGATPPSPASSSTPATSSTARSSGRAAGPTVRATASRSRPSTSPTRRTSPPSRRRCCGRASGSPLRRSTGWRRRATGLPYDLVVGRRSTTPTRRRVDRPRTA